jgi:hypothetical protein
VLKQGLFNVKRKIAHDFYKKIGFTETKEQKVFDKEIKWAGCLIWPVFQIVMLTSK